MAEGVKFAPDEIVPADPKSRVKPSMWQGVMNRLRKLDRNIVTYTVLLILLCGCSLTLEIIVVNSVDRSSDDGEIINQSGKQRARAQKIVKDAALLVNCDLPDGLFYDCDFHLEEMLDTAEDLHNYHIWLRFGNSEVGIHHASDSGRMRELYEVVSPLIREVEELTAEVANRNSTTNTTAIMLRMFELEDLLAEPLNDIVLVIEHEHNDRQRDLLTITWTMFGVVMALLVTQVQCVLRPMIKKVKDEAHNTVAKHKRRWLSCVAHDIRAPIDSLGLGVYLLLGSKLTREQWAILRDLSSALEILKIITTQIMELEKRESGAEVQPKLGAVWVPYLLQNARVIMTSFTTGHNTSVPIAFQVGADVRVPITSDPSYIWRMTLNLLSNATKHTTTGTITCKIGRSITYKENVRRSMLRCEVVDTGEVLSDAVRTAMFDPINLNAPEGTGLALYSIKQLAKELGGTVGFYNNRDTEGNVFWYEVPFIVNKSAPIIPPDYVYGERTWGISMSNQVMFNKEDKNGNSAVHTAISEDEPDKLRQYIKDKAQLGVVNHYGLTPLAWAYLLERQDMIAILTKAGAPLATSIHRCFCPLHCAVLQDHSHLLKDLVEGETSLDSFDFYGATALHLACAMNRLECVKILLELGCMLNVSNRFGATPVKIAHELGHKEIVKLLKDAGAGMHGEEMSNVILRWGAKFEQHGLENSVNSLINDEAVLKTCAHWDDLMANQDNKEKVLISFGLDLFNAFFEMQPNLRDLFPFKDKRSPNGLNQRVLRGHIRKVMMSLSVLIHGIQDADALKPWLNELIAKHIKFGVNNFKYYQIIATCILANLEKVMGTSWDDDEREAWGAALGMLTSTAKDVLEREQIM